MNADESRNNWIPPNKQKTKRSKKETKKQVLFLRFFLLLVSHFRRTSPVESCCKQDKKEYVTTKKNKGMLNVNLKQVYFLCLWISLSLFYRFIVKIINLLLPDKSVHSSDNIYNPRSNHLRFRIDAVSGFWSYISFQDSLCWEWIFKPNSFSWTSENSSLFCFSFYLKCASLT